MKATGLKPDAVFPPRSEETARRLEQLAWLMDQAIKIPGTRITIGLDALLGLLPVGGDLVGGLVQTGIVLIALAHYRVPRVVAARMAVNVLLDLALGAIPIVGDVFDVAFKANTRNLRLLNQVRQHAARGEVVPTGPSTRYLIVIGVVLGLALAAGLGLFVAVIGWVLRAWSSS
jgi:hypothetical protein